MANSLHLCFVTMWWVLYLKSNITNNGNITWYALNTLPLTRRHIVIYFVLFVMKSQGRVINIGSTLLLIIIVIEIHIIFKIRFIICMKCINMIPLVLDSFLKLGKFRLEIYATASLVFIANLSKIIFIFLEKVFYTYLLWYIYWK